MADLHISGDEVYHVPFPPGLPQQRGVLLPAVQVSGDDVDESSGARYFGPIPQRGVPAGGSPQRCVKVHVLKFFIPPLGRMGRASMPRAIRALA